MEDQRRQQWRSRLRAEDAWAERDQPRAACLRETGFLGVEATFRPDEDRDGVGGITQRLAQASLVLFLVGHEGGALARGLRDGRGERQRGAQRRQRAAAALLGGLAQDRRPAL